MLRGLRNQTPPMLHRQPPTVAEMGPLPMRPTNLEYQQVPDIGAMQAQKPGVLARLGDVISDPATSRALMAFGMNLIGSGDFGRAYNAGVLANDSYNERKLKEQVAEQNAILANRREDREDRKVGVLERSENIKAYQAEALARYYEMQGRAALMNAQTGRLNAETLAKHRRDLIALGYSRIEADREIALIREAAATERARMQQGDRGSRVSPTQAPGILAQTLSPQELERLQGSIADYAAALDSAAAAYNSGGGFSGARAAAAPMVPAEPLSFWQRLFGGGQTQAPAAQSPVRIRTVDEYNALQPGTRYIDPNGVLRTKQ